MLIKNMATQRRKFTDEEKLQILRQAGVKGIGNILRQNSISYSVFSRWRQHFSEQGVDPIGEKTEHRLLLEENTRLRKIIANLALSLEMKDEELKRITGLPEGRM